MKSPFCSVLMCCALLLAGATTGCSTFNHDWNKATSTAPRGDITGRWQGFWASEVNGHTGKLLCVISRIDGDHYRARYKATYDRVFHFGYQVKMKAVRETGDAFGLQGEANLGWLAGGVYHYAGRVTPENFACDYRSKYDHGTFKLTRPD